MITDPNAPPVVTSTGTAPPDPPPARHGARLDQVLLDADPHALAIVEARVAGEFRVDPRVELWLRRAILGTLERSPLDGDRGCFHEGCAPTETREEGGTHWCTLASISC